MIIKCEKCQTAFEFDDGFIIKLMGAKVLCLNCNHQFRIYPPIVLKKKDAVSAEKIEEHKEKSSESPLVSEEEKSSETDFPQRITKVSMRLKLTGSALLLLVLALGFNALLTLSSLEKLYVESIVSKYSIMGKDLQRNMENSLRFGKNIRKFIGIDKLLEETKQNLIRKTETENTSFGETLAGGMSESDVTVSVSLPNGTVLYSTDKELTETFLPEQIQINYKAPEKISAESRYVKYENSYIITLPLMGGWKKEWMANIVIAFDERESKALLRYVLIKNIKTIGIILLCGIMLLIVFLNMATLHKPDQQRLPKLKITLIMLLVIGSAQLGFTGLNTLNFKNYYLKISKEKMAVLATLLKEDIEYLLSKGLKIDKLVKMDVMLGEIIAASPEVDNITITDDQGGPLYTATKKGMVDFQKTAYKEQKYMEEIGNIEHPEYNLLLKVLKDETIKGYISTNSYQGFISANISQKVLFNKLKEIALDSVTVFIISLFFFVEMLMIVFQFVEKQFNGSEQVIPVHFSVIRPAVFLFLFGIDCCISFMPLYMEKLYEPIFGLSKDIVMGLPISTEMFFAAIAIFVAGGWLDRRGWYEPFFTGIFLAGIGMLYSWIAPDALQFIISRGLVGLGYGFVIMASQGFIFLYTDLKSKAQGLAQLWAGVYAGSICGGAAGAMMADRIGYRPIFFIGMAMVSSVVMYAVFFMRNAIQSVQCSDLKQHPFVRKTDSVASTSPRLEPTTPATMGQIFRFLFNRDIISLILCASIPASAAFVGFLYYFSPIYLSRIGESQSNIGRIYMIYGFCLIYIAPFVSRYVDASGSKKSYIVWSGILGSLSFIIFYFFGGLAATVITVLLLGLSGSFDASRAYVLKLKATRELGEGKAMAIYNSTGRIGQILGPLIFGWLIIIAGIQKGVTYFGLAYLFVTIIFFLIAQDDR